MKAALVKVIVAIVLFLTVSTMDYHDEVAEEKHYSHMVCNGHWPTYSNAPIRGLANYENQTEGLDTGAEAYP